MRLESAIGLKQQLLAEFVEPFTAVASGSVLSPAHAARITAVESALGAPRPFAVGAKAVDTVPGIQRSVALGVARRDDRYQLAIGVQRQALLKSPLVERLVREAKGEANVRLVGRIDKRGGSRGAALRPRRASTTPSRGVAGTRRALSSASALGSSGIRARSSSAPRSATLT